MALQNTLLNNLQPGVTPFSQKITFFCIDQRKLLSVYLSFINSCEEFVKLVRDCAVMVESSEKAKERVTVKRKNSDNSASASAPKLSKVGSSCAERRERR